MSSTDRGATYLACVERSTLDDGREIIRIAISECSGSYFAALCEPVGFIYLLESVPDGGLTNAAVFSVSIDDAGPGPIELVIATQSDSPGGTGAWGGADEKTRTLLVTALLESAVHDWPAWKEAFGRIVPPAERYIEKEIVE